ncbi:hypothetical protein [Halovenus halobia]|uniref:hypothetical protein n=1 Tax=Halovenus halobia TaxID=3396622 RepID=UPI003F559298
MSFGLGIFLDYENPKSILLPIIVISLVIATWGALGLQSVPDQKYGYDTHPAYNDCETIDDDNVYEYNELSSEAQEAFDSTVSEAQEESASAAEADRPVYITDSYHEFNFEAVDSEGQNCVRKDSQPYVLTVQKVGPEPSSVNQFIYRLAYRLGLFITLIFGGVLAGAVRS